MKGKDPEKDVPLVSVIVNNFNKGKYLKRCLNSIYNQSYENIEIVFWDDNSTDNSVDVFNRWSLGRKKRTGRSVKFGTTKSLNISGVPGFVPLGVTRWLALQMCIGKYVALCDSDDFWHYSKLQSQLVVKGIPDGVGASFTDSYIVGEHDCLLGLYSRDYPIPVFNGSRNVYKDLLTKRNFIVASSVVFDREKLMSVVGPPTHYTSGEDYDWLLKVAYKYDFVCDLQPLVNYRVVDQSLTHSKRNSTRATWYEMDAVVSAYNRNRKYKYYVICHLVKLYAKLLWKQFVREKF